MSAKDFESGYRSAAASILQSCLKELGYEGAEAEHSVWIIERESVILTLRSACDEFGDNDWDERLDLSDIINKHLIRPMHRNQTSKDE